MTEGLLLASAVSLLAVGAANLAVAILALRSARRYVDLAETRMERLRKDHARILRFLREERRVLHEMISEQQPEERGSELDVERDAGRRIDRLKRELLAPAAARRHRVIERESPPLSPEGPSEKTRGTGRLPEREAPPKKEARGKKPPPAGFPQTKRESSGKPSEDRGSHRAVWHPHPDDDVSPGGAPAEGTGVSGAPGGASVEIFRRHYDKYLENYEGYVKLAGRIYRMKDGAEAAPGSPAEHEWEERLRRVNDGIERTTARLDILEEYNPQLATDDRISRRASIARAHADLTRWRPDAATP